MTDTHIKINNVTPKVQYTGNGSTVSFPYSFAIFDDSDMVVYLGDAIITTGYTVSGAGQTEGGAVVFDTAPADGVKITLLRSVPIERVTDFQEGGTFRPKNINDEFDRQTAFVQQVQETLDRAVKVGPTSDITPEVVLAQVERVYSSIDNVDTVADNITDVNSVAANATNINTVAGSISDVNSVGASISNVNSVAADLTNVDSVAGDLTNIDTVAGIASDVSGVAAISSDVTAVNSNKTNINKVAGDISRVGLVADDIDSVHTVAVDISNVIDVADNKTNIDTVAGDISDVSTVSGSISNVNTVAGSISNVTAVAGNATNINAVAADLTDIESVASNITNVNAVADNETNINAAVSNATDISTVATNIANVGTVATNISDVNDCATNMADITSASANAALAKDWANKTGSTVDGSEYSAKYYAQQAASTLANKIDKGYAVNDFATNCITEIPQDIKLELSSGTLTLKSGSVITLPNGSQYQLTEDKTYTNSTTKDDGQYAMFSSRSTGTIQGPTSLANILSGPIANRPAWSSSIRGRVYYASDTNKITLAGGSGWNDDWGVALPFCIVTITNNVITSIDKVFNGAGYIGHHAFVLPGVKSIQAYGINSDGTPNTTNRSSNALAIVEMSTPSAIGTRAIGMLTSVPGSLKINYCGEVKTRSDSTLPTAWRYYYIADENRIKFSTDGTNIYNWNDVILVKYTYNGTSVTQFDISPVSGLSANHITTALTSVTGYDATKTQTLKHVSGTLTWVTDS